jgi:hypothetical protein
VLGSRSISNNKNTIIIGNGVTGPNADSITIGNSDSKELKIGGVSFDLVDYSNASKPVAAFVFKENPLVSINESAANSNLISKYESDDTYFRKADNYVRLQDYPVENDGIIDDSHGGIIIGKKNHDGVDVGPLKDSIVIGYSVAASTECIAIGQNIGINKTAKNILIGYDMTSNVNNIIAIGGAETDGIQTWLVF